MKRKPETSRREFLAGGRLKGAKSREMTVEPVDSQKTFPETAEDRSAHYLEHFSKKAMACEFELFFNMRQYSNSGVAAMEAFQLIDELEDQLSVYRKSSEISQLNREANQEWVRIEEGFFEVLVRGIEISQWTLGAFDMTSQPLSDIWGFTDRQGRVPGDTEILAALENVGYQGVRLNPENHSVRLEPSGLQVNLGGIGKGYALDRAALKLATDGIEDFVLHGGQSSVVARGRETRHDSEQESGWTVGLSHPTIPDRRLAEIYLRDMALATSGTGRQGFYFQGRRYGHIIDPRTGYPSDHCLSSTVISTAAADCDALATAFFVMKPEQVAEFCDEHPEFKVLMVVPANQPGGIEVKAYNMGPDDWKLLVPSTTRDMT